jgi:hypothetical protein
VSLFSLFLVLYSEQEEKDLQLAHYTGLILKTIITYDASDDNFTVSFNFTSTDDSKGGKWWCLATLQGRDSPNSYQARD